MRVVATLRALLADTRGATAIEYGLILALVCLAIIGAVSLFGVQVTAMYNNISTKSISAMG